MEAILKFIINVFLLQFKTACHIGTCLEQGLLHKYSKFIGYLLGTGNMLPILADDRWGYYHGSIFKFL